MDVGDGSLRFARPSWIDCATRASPRVAAQRRPRSHSGFNVIRRLKQRNPAGRIVVFSGFTSDVIRNHCRSLGADLVLGKHQNQELARHVEELTGSA